MLVTGVWLKLEHIEMKYPEGFYYKVSYIGSSNI